MKLYVAGPMTGILQFNYPAFRAAAAQLRALGHDVEDPSTNVNPTPEDYHGWLRAGLAQLITCEGVALLDGWETSGGARLEVNVGATLGLRVSPLAEWLAEGSCRVGDEQDREDVAGDLAGDVECVVHEGSKSKPSQTPSEGLAAENVLNAGVHGWIHSRRGYIEGEVVGGDEEWMRIRLTAASKRASAVARGHGPIDEAGQIITVRRDFLREIS